MKKHSASAVFVLVVLFAAFSQGALAQGPATGTPPFGTFGGGPFDVINLANLNAHFAIPVVDKAGRGIPFDYALSYDSSVWYPAGVAGAEVWTPVTNWGWRGQTEALIGYVTEATYQLTCRTHDNPPQTDTYNRYRYTAYHDNLGVNHALNLMTQEVNPCLGTGGIESAAETLADGSGTTISVDTSPSATVTSKGGQTTYPPLLPVGSGKAYDPNGNYLSTTGSSFVDTLGQTPLSISGSGTPSSPLVFTYPAPGGNATVNVNYTNYTVKTNFGLLDSGNHPIAEYGPTVVSLVSSIVIKGSDGSTWGSYAISYEATPSYSGDVTGRIAQITLPTGGSISYVYNSTQNDGSVTSLSRTVNDGSGHLWTYVRTGTGGNTDTVQDPDGNQTVYTFSGIYETQRKIYQGSATGTPLEQVVRCYNGIYPGGTAPNIDWSPCVNQTVATPITTQVIYPAFSTGGSAYRWSAVVNSYDSTYGRLTWSDEWDWTTGSATTPTRRTGISYASLGNGIVDHPSQVTIEDGSNTVQAQTTYYYDQVGVTATSGTPQHVGVSGSRGNLTEIDRLVAGSTLLKQHSTYYDTGTPNTTTDVNGTITTTTYGSGTSCGNSFPTSVTVIGWTTNATWNCAGAVPMTVTDPNSALTTTAYTDPYFWRPASVTDPLNNVTSFGYYAQTDSWASMYFNNNSSAIEPVLTTDSLGRPHVSSHPQGPGSSNFDSVEIDYDAEGRLYRTTMPYLATSGGGYGTSPSGTPATTTTYDALNRPTTVIDGTGSTITNYYYSQNDVLVSVPGPTGENAKMRQYEYDGLGRLTSVCEITQSLPGSAACGQNTTSYMINHTSVPMNGYKTTYTYDVLNDLTNVNQSGQTRTYAYDALGRLTAEYNPETGNTAQNHTIYTYDGVGASPCGGTSAGDLNKKVDAAANITCYYYDSLHRLTDVGYAGPTCLRYRYDYTTQTVGGHTLANAKGRLSEAMTDNCGGTQYTDEGFSYTARGELADFYESTPHSAGYYHENATYWPHGALKTLSLPSMPTITYGGLDGEGRTTTVTASSGTNPVTNVLYNTGSYSGQPLGALLSQTLGSGDEDFYDYDAATGRPLNYQFNVGSPTLFDWGTLTWNSNGSLAKLAITDQISNLDSGTCTYSHDDLGRVASVSCTNSPNPWSQSFSYDAFGNIKKSGSGSFVPTSYVNNQPQGFGITWDANGNPNKDSLGNTFTWNQYRQAANINGLALTYDALGRLVEQPSGVSYLSWVYLPNGFKAAAYNGQALNASFIPLLDGGSAVYVGSAPALYLYRHGDWLGTSRLTTYTSGQSAYFDTGFAPFGELYGYNSGSDRVFTGQMQQIAVGTGSTDGLYDFMFREYSPAQGRWISPDPAGVAAVDPSDPQSWNRYSYTENIPTEAVDSNGLRCTFFTFGFKNNQGQNSNLAPNSASSYPYNGLRFWGSLKNDLSQSLFGANDSTRFNAYLANMFMFEPGGIDFVNHSGGAQVNSSAIQSGLISTFEVASITNLSPGLGLGGSLAHVGDTMSFHGGGIKDLGATIVARIEGEKLNPTGCNSHDFSCEFLSNPVQTRLQSFVGSRGPCTLGGGGGGGGGAMGPLSGYPGGSGPPGSDAVQSLMNWINSDLFEVVTWTMKQ